MCNSTLLWFFLVRALADDLVDKVAAADVDAEMLLQKFPSVIFERKPPEEGIVRSAMYGSTILNINWVPALKNHSQTHTNPQRAGWVGVVQPRKVQVKQPLVKIQ